MGIVHPLSVEVIARRQLPSCVLDPAFLGDATIANSNGDNVPLSPKQLGTVDLGRACCSFCKGLDHLLGAFARHLSMSWESAEQGLLFFPDKSQLLQAKKHTAKKGLNVFPFGSALSQEVEVCALTAPSNNFFPLPLTPPHLYCPAARAEQEKEQEERDNRDQKSGPTLVLSQLSSFAGSQMVQLSYLQRCVREGTSKSLPFSLCQESQVNTVVVVRYSALVVIGVHQPPALNDDRQRAWVPLGHCVAADPYVTCSTLCKGTGRAGGACTAWGQAGRHLELQERDREQILGSCFWCLL